MDIKDIGTLSIVCGDGIITREGSRLCSSCAPGYYDSIDDEGMALPPSELIHR